MAKQITLTGFSEAAETKLVTNASKSGIGFILRQQDTNGAWRAIQCGSRALAGHKANWSAAAELEALAIAWAAKKCTFFLTGLQHFTIITDCSPLLAIFNTKTLMDIDNNRLIPMLPRTNGKTEATVKAFQKLVAGADG